MDTIHLSTGELRLEQLQKMLIHLPVDLSFVDADDRVRFYSESPHRVFPRSPQVIGRNVTDCHPKASVDKVREILDALRDGSRDRARFWIESSGRFVIIQYIAVRDDAGSYLGCLEVSQDATEIRALEGERRLADWS